MFLQVTIVARGESHPPPLYNKSSSEITEITITNVYETNNHYLIIVVVHRHGECTGHHHASGPRKNYGAEEAWHDTSKKEQVGHHVIRRTISAPAYAWHFQLHPQRAQFPSR